MMKIIATLALALASTAANAVTFTFDFKFNSTANLAGATVSDIPDEWMGTGQLTFDEKVKAQADTSGQNNATYDVPFSLTLTGTGYSLDLSTSRGSIYVVTNITTTDSDFILFFQRPVYHGPFLGADGYQSYLPNADLSAANVEKVGNSPYAYSSTVGHTRIDMNDQSQRVAEVTNFHQLAAPVPEPAEWAMMGVGLALVGGIARRRRAVTM